MNSKIQTVSYRMTMIEKILTKKYGNVNIKPG